MSFCGIEARRADAGAPCCVDLQVQSFRQTIFRGAIYPWEGILKKIALAIALIGVTIGNATAASLPKKTTATYVREATNCRTVCNSVGTQRVCHTSLLVSSCTISPTAARRSSTSAATPLTSSAHAAPPSVSIQNLGSPITSAASCVLKKMISTVRWTTYRLNAPTVARG